MIFASCVLVALTAPQAQNRARTTMTEIICSVGDFLEQKDSLQQRESRGRNVGYLQVGDHGEALVAKETH